MANDVEADVYSPSYAVKAVGEDGWRVGGYLVLFSSASDPDLQGEYFTKSTDLGMDWYPRRPMLFEHGKDATLKSTLIGTIDRLEQDEVGVWAEGVLDRRNKYAQKVRDLVAKGALGWSSGSMSHLVKKTRQGEIVRWPICEASITATPAEPRTLAVPVKAHISEAGTVISAYKSLGISTDRLEPQDAADGAMRSSGSGVARSNASNVATAQGDRKFSQKGIKMDSQTMTKDELQQMVAEVVQKKLQQNATRHQLPAPQQQATKNNIEVIGDTRYAELSSQDMSFLVSVYAGIAAASRNKTSHSPLEQAARDFFYRAATDPDRKIQREISAKALREQARGQLSDNIVNYLPYKSLNAVDANDYDDAPIKAAIKANELDNTGQTGFGLEWVPTIWNNDLWRRVRMSNPFAGTIQMIDMPSNPFNLPIESTDPTVYFVAEGTDSAQLVLGSGNTITLSKVASDKRQISAKKLGTRIGFSTELVEDSIIPILPYYRYQAQRVLQNYVDDTIVNGDTAAGANTNINLIDSTPAAGTSYLALDGIRKYALVTNTTQAVDAGGGNPTMALFRNLRKTLNKHYAADLPNLVYVISWEVYLKMLGMPEFSNWQSLGIAGSNMTGLLPLGSANQVSDAARPVGVIDGIPVYVSAQINLAQANGKISNTPANNTLGTVVLYHRTRWFLGYRRHINLDVQPTGMFSDTYQLWATVRFGLQSFDASSAAVLYDLAV